MNLATPEKSSRTSPARGVSRARACPGRRPVESGTLPAGVHDVLASPGRPMDGGTRDFFEPRFGHDFGRVRIHADARAQASAAAVDARAYTVGDNIVLGRGADASAASGRRLMAHELAHVVQQDGASPGCGMLSFAQDAAAEREADSAADRVSGASGSGGTPALSRAPATRLQRQPTGGSNDGLKRLEKTANDAMAQAGQKVMGGGQDKQGGHIPTGPELRHVPDPDKKPEPKTHVPKENLRPDPHEKPPPPVPVPDKPEAKTPEKPDPGKREGQAAEGVAYQSGPNQTGMAVQGAFQDKNYVPGAVYDLFEGFKAQVGVLQPTYTLQYSHLQPTTTKAGTAADPLPPPDNMTASATFSPVVITKGNLTIAPQVGVAAAVGWDGSGGPKQVGSSGTHGQLLGVVNLQIDYKLDDSFSITGSVGDQGGLDRGPEGNKGTNALTGSVLGTLHF